MFSLRWKFPDYTDGYVVGTLDNLSTVYFVMNKTWKNLVYQLTFVGTGCDTHAVWFEESKRGQ